jgi:hypothetical protein
MLNRKKVFKFTTSVVVFFILLEISLRLFFFFNIGISSTSKINILKSTYYSELHKVDGYQYNPDKKNILILGGSVVYEDTIPFFKNSTLNQVSFCGFKELDTLKYNVLNLAYPAHTSLDSKYKFELLKAYKFDFVVIYHGINDSRSNNVDSIWFDENYRHMEFYDELYVLHRHSEIKYFVSFYMLDYITLKLLKYFGFKHYIPKEFLKFLDKQDEEVIDQYFNKGCKYFTIKPFYNNINTIILNAINRNIKPVLFTYAFYQPKEYSLNKFYDSALDYNTNYFPTELYGDPKCIPSNIKEHNNQILKLNEIYGDDIVFQDFNSNLNKDCDNFMDICHLTNFGCHEMYATFIHAIEGKKTNELWYKDQKNQKDK